MDLQNSNQDLKLIDSNSLLESVPQDTTSVASKNVESISLVPKFSGERSAQIRKPYQVSYFQPILTGIQICADSLTILLSFILGYSLWNIFGPMLASQYYAYVPFSEYYFSLGVTLVTCLIGFRVNGLYEAQRSILNIREFEIILKTCLIGCMLTMSILFLSERQFFSRGVFAITWTSILSLMFVQRYLFFRFQNHLRSAGVIETSVLIYGAGRVGKKLLEKLHQSPKLGHHVLGFLDDNSSLEGTSINGVPVLGDVLGLKQAIQKTGANKLLVAIPRLPQKTIQEILKICQDTECEFQMVPSLYDLVVQKLNVSEVDGLPLIGVAEPKYSFRTMVAKRVFDFTLASILLVILSPLLVTLALIVKLTSTGPVFFKQKRVGKFGQKFVFYKFRSMYTHTPVYAITPEGSKDVRITAIGRFLRRSSLDELPQLFNVLTGQMSLVGPRPEMPFIVDEYNEMQRQRLNVRPGITGLWQISKDRKFAIHHNMDYDIYYINNQSFLLDIVILMRTGISCVVGVGAY